MQRPRSRVHLGPWLAPSLARSQARCSTFIIRTNFRSSWADHGRNGGKGGEGKRGGGGAEEEGRPSLRLLCSITHRSSAAVSRADAAWHWQLSLLPLPSPMKTALSVGRDGKRGHFHASTPLRPSQRQRQEGGGGPLKVAFTVAASAEEEGIKGARAARRARSEEGERIESLDRRERKRGKSPMRCQLAKPSNERKH